MRRFKLLFIEDSPLDAELLIRHIKKSGFDPEYEIVDSLSEIDRLLIEQAFDLVICDFKLPGFSGIDALNKIIEFGEDLPVVFVSGAIPDEKAIDAVLAGAKDYILKDNLRRLVPALHRELDALEQRREKKKSDALLEAVFDSPIGVRISNESRKIIKVNRAYCDMMGYTESEVIGSSIDEIIPENQRKKDQEDYKKFINEYLDKGINTPITKIDVRKDGTYIDVLVNSKVFKTNGEILVVSTIQDVSEVFKYKTLFEESGHIAKLGGWERDVASGKEVWTKQIYEIYGVSEDSFDPEVDDDARFHTPKSVELLESSVKDAIENGTPFDIEVEIIDANGNEKWCRGTGNPIYENDKVVKLIGSFQDITERKSRELEIKKNEEKYKFLFDHNPNPMFILEVGTDKVIDGNLAAETLYGYSKKEFKKLKGEELRPKEHIAEYRKRIKRRDSYENSDEIQTFTSVIHKKKNNELIVVDIYSRYAKISGHRAIIVVVNDITEKYQYEQQLLKTSNLLTALISNAPIGLVSVNEKGEVEELWNPRAEEIFGWTREEVLGKRLPYVQKSKIKDFKKNLELGLKSKLPFITQLERVNKNGETIFLKEFVTPLLDKEGNVNKLMLLIEDITEKQKIENALISSEQKYRNLVEASHDLVWRIDPDGYFNFINSASKSILGYSPDEMIGKSFVKFVNPKKADELMGIHNDVILGETYESFPLEMVTSTGEMRHLSGMAYPMLDENSNIIGCSGTATDITHLTKYQSQLEDSLAEKEILIKEIHHRVKNNLAVISGLFVLQSIHVEDEETLGILQESQSRIKSIATIHEKLYQNDVFSSIEMKSYLKNLVLDIADTYQRNDKDIKIEVTGNECSLTVNQAVPFGILANELIINCYKYAFENRTSGKITINLKYNKQGLLIFSVSDDGIGLPENFDVAKLTSLGMTLVRTLASQLEAEFEWETTSKKGTIFKIAFTPTTIPTGTWVQKKPDRITTSQALKK
ncbi:MAG: PAS domain S-box protein [Balneola sp.]